MEEQLSPINQMVIQEWRNLGFYYDLDERLATPVWQFFASKVGFQRFASLLMDYAGNPVNKMLSEHEHYGPYHYLKVMTSDQNRITKDVIEVTISGALELADILRRKTHAHSPGQTFSIDGDFGSGNTAATLFFVMDENFDPPYLDSSVRLLTEERKIPS